jgi:hypothetical protein
MKFKNETPYKIPANKNKESTSLYRKLCPLITA